MTRLDLTGLREFREAIDPFDPAESEAHAERRAAALLHHPELFPRAQEANPEAAGMFRIIGEAISTEWRLSWAARQFMRSGYEVDPSFDPFDKETWDALTEGLPSDLVDGAFDNAVSIDHAMQIREQLSGIAESERILSEAGWTGLGARIGAMILDPVDIAVTAGTLGIAGASIYATKIGRLQRAVRAGFAVAAPQVALEAYTASQDPNRDVDSVIYAGLGAFTLGSVGGALLDRSIRRAALSWQKQIELEDIRRAGLDLTDDGRVYFKRELAGESRSQVIGRMLDSIEDMPDATRDALSRMSTDDVLAWVGARTPVARQAAREGAEQALESSLLRQPGDLDFSVVPTPGADTGLVSRLRFDMGGILSRSPIPGARKLAHLLAENPIPRADGTPTIQSASEWKSRMSRVFMSRYHRTANDEFNAWRKANKRSAATYFADRVEFMEEVGRAMRFEPGVYSSSRQVNKVADLQRELYGELLGIAKRYRIPGFSAIEARDTYVPRIYSTSKIHSAVDRFGEKNVVRLFRDAILRQSDDLLEEQAEKIAAAHVSNIRNLDRTTHLEKVRMFDPDQSELLRRVIRDEFPDVTDAQLEDIIFAVRARPSDAGAPPRAKRRLGIDESTSIEVEGVGTLRVDDLLENNAEVLMELYARQMLGHSAMAEVHRGMSRGPDDVVMSFDTLLRRVEAEGKAAGVNEKKINGDLKRLTTMYRSIVDLPMGGEFGPRYAEWTRHLRGLNFMRVMGQVGFAQAAETAMLLGEGGFVRTITRFPTALKLIRGARSGKLDNESIRDIELLWGFGTDRVRNQVTSRFDAAEALRDYGGGRLDMMLRTGQKLVGDASLITPIMMGQQRMAAGVAMDKWATIARSGKLPSAKRLASMGLTEQDARRIIAQISDHSTTYRGVTGVQMRDINLSAWKDGEAASKFIVAVDKWTRRVIQTNDIGNLAHWMTYDTARMILQFRIFPTVAWSKHLLHGMRMSDFTVASTFTYGMILSGLLYTARTHLNSIGRSDAEKYRAERLTWNRIAAGGFYHNAYSSLLPMIADTAAYLGEVDQPFQFTRTTGLATQAWIGNPTFDWFDQAMMGTRGGINLLRPDRDFTQRDAHAIARALPFQNILGIQNMVNRLSAELPEESE